MPLLYKIKYFETIGTCLNGSPCWLRFTGTSVACELFKDLADGVLATTERKRWRPHPPEVGTSRHTFDRRSTTPPCGTSGSKNIRDPSRKRGIPELLG